MTVAGGGRGAPKTGGDTETENLREEARARLPKNDFRTAGNADAVIGIIKSAAEARKETGGRLTSEEDGAGRTGGISGATSEK